MVGKVGTFYEFFAGAGMARAGLGDRWRCLFANDFDHKKAATYRLNWGMDNFVCSDVREVKSTDLQQTADLVWASFPCQDLSLAGGGAGLKGERSGTFWPFWDLMTKLVADGREPSMIVLENVCGDPDLPLGQRTSRRFASRCRRADTGSARSSSTLFCSCRNRARGCSSSLSGATSTYRKRSPATRPAAAISIRAG